MTRYREVPYTSDDLREIADQVDKITKALNPEDEYLEEGDWRWGLIVEVYDEFNHSVGQVKAYGDGWLGFYPKAVTE